MSNQRPVSMDVAQEDEYGSDDDNEIDRINREKKETLQLSMNNYFYIVLCYLNLLYCSLNQAWMILK